MIACLKQIKVCLHLYAGMVLLLFTVVIGGAVECQARVDDSKITIVTPADVARKRAALVDFTWGKGGFPATKMPSSVQRSVQSPVQGLKNLARVDTLRISMAVGLIGMSHQFVPKHSNRRLAILHLGHTSTCTFNDGLAGESDVGIRKTLLSLLSKGFTVLAVYMPQQTPEDCREHHDQLFNVVTTGNPMKFFLEPTIVSLNYALSGRRHYRDVSMIGFSGGGWTTTLCAAIDPRIKTSIHVAGSLPIYLRWGWTFGHTEQNLDSFYGIAGYPDLYIMGAFGSGRSQLQVLNRHDDCCFGERQHNSNEAGATFESAVRAYETRVRQALKKLGAGSFRVAIDDTATRHMISGRVIDKVILPALN